MSSFEGVQINVHSKVKNQHPAGGKNKVYIDQVKENKIQYLIKFKIGKDGMRGNNIDQIHQKKRKMR